MGRSREFEESQVLQDAMRVFWQQGYRGTSLKELEQATGLKPGSLYHAYGNKHGLFLRVLDHYIETIITPRVQIHLRDTESLHGVRRFMETAFDYVSPRSPSVACLLVNTAVEMGREDPEILRRLMRGFKLIESGLRGRLEAAQQAGELDPCKDVPALARQLAVSFQGILVTSRLTTQRARLFEMTDTALAVLN